MNKKIKLVLGSSSQHRKEIFDMIGLKYEVITSKVDEESNEKNPQKYVIELSKNKAESVASQLDDKALIVTSDTILYKDNKFYEKPKSKEEALNNLKELSGSVHYATTGTTILDLYNDKVVSYSDTCEIKFKDISDEEAKWYVDNEKKMMKCCGYSPLGMAAIFIEKVNGNYNTFFGINPELLMSNIEKLGYSINDFEIKN